MPSKKKHDTVIAVCIQEPYEDGSKMDLGSIDGAELRFLHQAFITDTITNALAIKDADVRLFYVDKPERKRLVDIITDYLKKKKNGGVASELKSRFGSTVLPTERWGIRIEQIFQECFKTGYKHVLVIGSRTPTITPAHIEKALQKLKEGDAVFGPTPEGRYYVIGMSKKYSIKLSEFDWKDPSIYSLVSEAFTKKELEWAELEIWYCVESSDDLEMMARDINQCRFEGDDKSARETELVMERILTQLGN